MKLWRSTASSSLCLRRRLLTVNRSHFLRSQVAWFSEYKEAFVYDPSRIRNFSIIAHVDHGKSTLADRLLQTTGTIPESEMQNQVLDNMELERERGITIKLQAARMNYKANNGENYLLNLIDTPGHVDFGYEVSRSLAACEGALLVVDASQGVEAQTMANVYLALENNLEIVPVINKIDLPTANADRVRNEMEGTIGMDCSEAIPASAKHGIGVDKILEAIVHKIPPPAGDPKAHLQALIFDSYYDTYRGVIVFFRVVNGSVKKLDKIKFKNSGKEFEVMEVGIMTPKKYEVDVLRAGEVGYLAANVKSVHDARVGDTFTHAEYAEQVDPLPGYEPAKQMVYAGVYPSDSAEYETLRDAINKLKLNDAALSFAPEVSVAMGTGFRCGFLGLLHMDIVQERLEREYNLNLIVTAPSVRYKIVGYDGTETYIESPAELPDTNSYKAILEPYVKLEIISPSEHIGAIMDLASDRRGEYVEMKYLTSARVNFIFEIPLAEVITDFFDDLKSLSKGYASMSFHDCGYRENDLVKLKILINNEDAPPLATIIHRDKAYHRGRAVCLKLKELIPRQLFKVPIQAAVGTKVIAAEHITPVRKDVLAKCYGGDVTRKKKLLAKQAEGKKRMKMIGRVNVPQEAFLSVIKAGRGENEE